MPRLDLTLSRLQRYDERVCLGLNRASRLAPVRHVFRAVSRLGDGVFWYALMLALLLQDAESALVPVLHMMLVGIACTATYSVLKRGTGRRRPFEVVPAVAAHAAPLD